MLRTRILIFIVLFNFSNAIYGQRLSDMVDIPAAPQTSALFKSIAAPVSYYTGQPDVSIPIYTISQDGVTLPISISFNTSGIFVNEEATNIGLGVKLNWGGSIIRSANGRPDERGFFTEAYRIGELKEDIPKNYSVYTPPIPALCYPYCDDPTNLQKYKDRIEEYYYVNKYTDPYTVFSGGISTDLRPDDFFYNFLGKSGLFKFNQLDRQFVAFPLDDIKIDKTLNNQRIESFTVTKSDGVKTVFGEDAVESTTKFVIPFDQSWFIKKITTIKNSTIDFSYIENQFMRTDEGVSEITFPYPLQEGNGSRAGESYRTTEKLIKTINFNAGKLEFIYSRDRSDINVTAENSPNDGLPAPRLSEIILYDINNSKIKSFTFFQTYFVANSSNMPSNSFNENRLRLDSISINDKVSNRIERYKFEYYTNTTIPAKKNLSRDHWGYYNGQDNNNSLIPSSIMPLPSGYQQNGSSSSNISNRYVNSLTNRIFTIKKIIFPSGGEREFDFEDNQVSWYDMFAEMKDISNDGFDLSSHELIVGGTKLQECFPAPDYTNYNDTERIVYGNEFDVQDFNDVVIGDPSLFIETTFINPEVTNSELNMWQYEIQIGLEKKSSGVFTHYSSLSTVNKANYSGTTLKGKLPILPDGTYRLYVKLVTPPPYIMDNWRDQYDRIKYYDHNTIVRLAFRKKNFENIRVGGLRIKSITDRESNNQYTTEFEYVNAGGGAFSSGHLFNIPQYIEYISGWRPNPASGYDPLKFSGYRINSQAVFPLTKTQGSNVGYSNVVKKIIGNGIEEIREEFTYSYKPNNYKGYFQEYYKEVSPKPWQNGKLLSNRKYLDNVLIAEDEYDYYGLSNETDMGSIEEINPSLIDGSYEFGGFSDTKWNVWVDKRHDNPITYWGGKVDVPLYDFDSFNAVYHPQGGNSNLAVSPTIKNPYFRLYTGFDKIKSKTTKNYFGTEVITQKENYHYDALPTYTSLSRLVSINSKNDTLLSRYYYPYNFISEPNMSEMIASFRVGSPIKTEKFINNTKLFEEKFIYAKDASTNDLLLPKYLYSANFPNYNPVILEPAVGKLEKDITYDRYGVNGNLLEYHKENGTSTSLIWSYSGQHVVAEVKNAGYTSIENIKSTGALQSLRNSFPDRASLDAFLTDLKQGLPDAEITSYTYKPLVGMTSQTDPKGMTTYYEYDSFQRLLNIKDHNGDIVKNYRYNYQQDEGSTVYYNDAVNRDFQKDDCPWGQTGSTVNYPVAAGTYSAATQEEANGLAAADLSANGQAYANTHGTCSGGSTAYYNTALSQSFQKNDCPSGQTGSSVTYTVPANTYSASSQSAADAQATADMSANGQAYANNNGTCSSGTVYYNTVLSQGFQKNDCPSGQTGSPVTYTVPANTYSASTQAAADAQATADMTANGQAYANTNGTCSGETVYYNVEASQHFARNDCPEGKIAYQVSYTVPTGTYSASTQVAADALAAADIAANGQAYANSHGQCLDPDPNQFFNAEMSKTFRKNDCGTGYVGSLVTYTVPANLYSSGSQQGADVLAANNIAALGQGYANTHGTCTAADPGVYYSVAMSQSFQRNNCGSGGTGTSATYTVPAGLYTGSSQSAADALAAADLAANGQNYANTVAWCNSTVYYNAALSQNFQKNDCPSGETGSVVTFTIPANTYSGSTQAAADAQAAADMSTYGQVYANGTGSCLSGTVYYNTEISYAFQKDNCPSGQTGSSVTYTVPAGTYPAGSQYDADMLAVTELVNNGQVYANNNGTCSSGTVYYNTVLSQSFQKNDCPSGQTGSSVTYTVPANTYSASTQSAADAQATADMSANGQAYANTNGSCSSGTVYYNVARSQGFQKNDCPSGQSGNVVIYTVPAGTYSAGSQGEADNLSYYDISTNGQAYANSNGTCSPGTVYYNVHLSLPYQKNDCPPGYVGSTVMFTVPAGTYSASTQAAANDLATTYIYANGRANANANGTCIYTGTYYNTVASQSFQKNDCTSGTGAYTTYTVPAGTYSASTQAAADAQAAADITANGQSYANTNGDCNGGVRYAKILINNVSVTDNMHLTPGTYQKDGDVYIQLYSDAACTIPFTATATMYVHIRYTVAAAGTHYPGGYSESEDLYIEISPNTTGTLLGNSMLNYSYYDTSESTDIVVTFEVKPAPAGVLSYTPVN